MTTLFQLDTHVSVPLSDDTLSKATETTLTGYEILDACSITMALENHIWRRYRECHQDQISSRENRLLNAYMMIPAYARQISDAWFGIKDDMNFFYEEYLMNFIKTYEFSSTTLHDLALTLELESSKSAFVEILQSLLNRIYNTVGPKVDVLVRNLNQFKGYVESQAREGAKQIDHIYQEILGRNGSSFERFSARMKEIQGNIGDLNEALLRTVYLNKINKAITIDQIAVGGGAGINAIALVSNKREHASLSAVLKADANRLNNQHVELQDVVTQVKADTSGEFASVMFLNSELFKLQSLASTMVWATTNFRNAWAQLSTNLEGAIERLKELKVIQPELKNLIITIHLSALQTNMERMREHIATLIAHRLLKMPIAKEIVGKLEFLGPYHEAAIHPFVLEEYLKNMHYEPCRA